MNAPVIASKIDICLTNHKKKRLHIGYIYFTNKFFYSKREKIVHKISSMD